MWYVIQVRSGREEIIRKSIQSVLSEDSYEECRIIYWESMRRYQGAWHKVQKIMFPGYLFIQSQDVGLLSQELRKIQKLTKLLHYDHEIVALTPSEKAFMYHLLGDQEVVEMSYGIQEGDQVIVMEGPLKGQETRIRRIDRHKRKAIIEVHFLGTLRELEIGLEIVEKKP